MSMSADDTQDPRDVADQLGLQDARDDSDPGWDEEEIYDHDLDAHLSFDRDGSPSWRDRYDTREEWEESR
jgi:hypothetical protein